MAKKRSIIPLLGAAVIVILAFFFIMTWSLTGGATAPVNISAVVTQSVSCAASSATLSFGTLTLAQDRTTSTGVIIDATGSTSTTGMTASVTTATSWIPGFTSNNTAWGILCPNDSTDASGLSDYGLGAYKQHEFSPNTNKCRSPAGISGAMIGLGNSGSFKVTNFPQVPTSQVVFSRIKAPAGTTPGSYWTIVTFTCTEITGGAAGLASETVDIENTTHDASVKCDGTTNNVYVVETGLGPVQAQMDDGQAPIIYVCNSTGRCVAGVVVTPNTGPTCTNTVAPIANTPNAGNDEIICGTFKCPPDLVNTVGNAQVWIEAGPLVSPSNEYVSSYMNVTITP